MKPIVYILILFLSLSNADTKAQNPGDLDLTFNGSGIVNADFGKLSDDYVTSMAIQSDGKKVIAIWSDAIEGLGVMRFNTDGSRDNSFGNNGIAITVFPNIYPFEYRTHSLIIQTDGKILETGYANAFKMIRYNQDGSLDNSFATNGIFSFDYGFHDRAITLQPDGKILIGGDHNDVNSDADFSIIRLNSNGTYDNSFGTEGKLTFGFSGNNEDKINSLAVQSNGKIVASGQSDLKIFLMRFNQDGSFDNSFNDDGIKNTIIDVPYPDYDEVVENIVLQQNGKIVISCPYWFNSTYDFRLIRYQTDGSLDHDFGIDGVVTTDIGGKDIVTSIAIQSDDKILISGWSDYSVNLPLLRYLPDGLLDNSFGTGGINLTNFGTNAAIAGRAVAIGPNGKISLAGVYYDEIFPSYSDSDIIFTQYSSNGVLDNSFRNDGILIENVGIAPTSDHATTIAVQPNGKIIVGGSTYPYSGLMRFKPDGSLDEAFGTDGKVTTNWGDNEDVNDLIIQPDGKIITAGDCNQGGKLARYHFNGTPDNSFGDNGIATINFDNSYEYILSIALQSDGKIVAGGGTNSKAIIFRFNNDGSLDSSFANVGFVLCEPAFEASRINAVAIQTDGKILAISEGVNSTGLSSDFLVARYQTDGVLDNSFGEDGIVYTEFINNAYEIPTCMALQTDGKIVVAGSTHTNLLPTKIAVARYNNDGSLDNSFHETGKAITSFGANISVSAKSLVIQPDGKIVSSATTFSDSDGRGFAVLRYESDGLLDLNFGVNGKAIIAVDTFSYQGGLTTTVALQPDGKIVFTGPVLDDFTVFRLISGLQVGTLDFNKEDHSLLIYPNPITERATLEYNLAQPEYITIQLTDLQGKVIVTYLNRQQQYAGEYQQEIILPETLPSGMYFITISSPGGKECIKILH